MDKNLFAELMGSVSEANEILKGERSPSRELHVSPVEVREIRRATGLSQQKFAARWQANGVLYTVVEGEGPRVCLPAW